MRLIDDWRHAWKFFSVIGAALLLVANLVVANSDALQALLPANTLAIVNAAAALVIGASRIVKQNLPARDCATEPAAPAPTEEAST